MFTFVTESGPQFTLAAFEAARLLNCSERVRVVARNATTIVIAGCCPYVSDDEPSRVLMHSFNLTAPAPNGLDMIYQAGGPLL